MTREKRASKNRRRQTALAPRRQTPTLADLLDRPKLDLEKADIALLNLLCAVGLPGAENLDIPRLLGKLDEWAKLVRLETDRNYYKFFNSSGRFNNSQACFCVVCMISVLQDNYGVRYDPKWKGRLTPEKPMPLEFGTNAKDQFIHAVIDGPGGTCGSLPVLYAAVGRRLGYPLNIVKAEQHFFLRWDDPKGEHWFHPERFNFEVTMPGVHCPPDGYYKTWPRELPPEDIEAGIYLKSLTPKEELAEFVAMRARCFAYNNWLVDGIKTMRKAAELAPHNRHFKLRLKEWKTRYRIYIADHEFLSKPANDGPKPPHWVSLPNGRKMPNTGQQFHADHPVVPNGSLSPCSHDHFRQSVGSPLLMPWAENHLPVAIRQIQPENRQRQLPFHFPPGATVLPPGLPPP